MTTLLHFPTSTRSASTLSGGVAIVHLEPDERMSIDPAEGNVIGVADGLVCLRLGDNDVMLQGGERVVLPQGGPIRAWNAGDDPAQVIIGSRAR